MKQLVCSPENPNGVLEDIPEDILELMNQPPLIPWYATQRQAEYPPIADYLDGVVKGDQAQIQAYIDACLAVKAKYPKPTE